MTGVRKRPRKQRDERAAQYESPLFHQMCTRLAANLYRLRAERGLTLQEIANRCGMVMQNYHELEKGRGNPTFTTLARLAEGFGVDVTDLLDDTHAANADAIGASADASASTINVAAFAVGVAQATELKRK
jgi:transcriptional regulator with XRE-family HTH domain